MEIISIINRKGGVGKTTTAVNLGAALAQKKKNILLIDCDSQKNCTLGVGIPKDFDGNTLYDVYCNDIPILKSIYNIQENIDILPADQKLNKVEIELHNKMERERILKDKIEEYHEEISGEYDYILIDNSPSLNLLAINTMVAADSLIIPLESGGFSLDGLSEMLQKIRQIRKRLNPNLEILGVLLTRADNRTNLEQEFKENLKGIFKDKVLSTIINQNVDLKNASMNNESIFEYNKSARGAKDYMNLAEEVLAIEQKR